MTLWERIQSGVREFAAPNRAGSLKGNPDLLNKKQKGEIGDTGTLNYSGFIEEDPNPEFNDAKAVWTYEEMRRTDACIAAVLRAVKYPILATERWIESGDKESDLANEQAAFVRDNLFNVLEPRFNEVLEMALTYLEFGFSYFEKVYNIRNGMVTLVKLGFRKQTAHFRWFMPSQPDVPGIQQLLRVFDIFDGQTRETTHTPEIPMKKLVLFTHQKEGMSFQGISALRPVYINWYYKSLLYRLDSVKMERGAGILEIEYPNSQLTPNEQAAVNDMGNNFKLNEKAFISHPANWRVDLIGKGFSDQSEHFIQMITHHNYMIMLNFLTPFLNLGSGTGMGSYALSADQSSFFALSENAICDYVASIINVQIIKELVDRNWGPQKVYPKLKFSRVGTESIRFLADAIFRLASVGAINLGPDEKAWIYKAFNMPDKSPEDFVKEQEEADKKAQSDAGVPATETTGGAEDAAQPADESTDPDAETVENQAAQDAQKKATAASKAPGSSSGSNFSETGQKKSSLTPSEERMDLKGIKVFFNQKESDLKKILSVLSRMQKIGLMEQVSAAIESKDSAAISNLTMPQADELTAHLMAAAKASVEEGKRTAAKEMKVAMPTSSGEQQRMIAAKLKVLADTRNNQILEAIKFAALAAIVAGATAEAGTHAAEMAFDTAETKADANLAGSVAVGLFNQGRAQTFAANKPAIYALQRTEILDDKICPTCEALNGRVLSSNDPFTKLDLVHTNCRGMWTPILNDDTDHPDIQTIPKSLGSKFQTIAGVPQENKFVPVKK